MRTRAMVWIPIAALAVACGGNSAEKQAEEPAKQVEKAAEQAQSGAKDVQQSAEQMAKGLEALGKGLAGMAGAANMKPVDPVSFRELQTVFPDLEGWEKGKPTGERMTVPVPFSQAEVRYTKGDATIEGKIVDSGFNQLLIAPFSMFLVAGYEKETEDGYEKSTKIGGYPGWEKWTASGKRGELNAIVNKRFIVTFEGEGIADTKVLYEMAEKADLAKLAAVK